MILLIGSDQLHICYGLFLHDIKISEEMGDWGMGYYSCPFDIFMF